MEVRTSVLRLLAGVYPNRNMWERRDLQRFPYPRLITLAALSGAGNVESTPAVVVVGKDISERGLSFYHPTPIAHRLMIARLEPQTGARADFVLDLSWCRFTRDGWYESGGRFLRLWTNA